MAWGALIGGVLGAGASLWANAQNLKYQREANNANYRAQKEFYQNSVLWRKQDAERSGINAIYALGAGNASFSPSFEAANNTFGADAQNAITTGLQGYYQARQLKLQQAKDEAQIQHLQALTAKAAAETAAISGSDAGNSADTSGVLDPVKASVVSNDGKKTPSQLSQLKDGDFFKDFLPGSNNGLVYAPIHDDKIVVAPSSQSARDSFYDSMKANNSLTQALTKIENQLGFKMQKEISIGGKRYKMATFETHPNGVVYYPVKDIQPTLKKGLSDDEIMELRMMGVIY